MFWWWASTYPGYEVGNLQVKWGLAPLYSSRGDCLLTRVMHVTVKFSRTFQSMLSSARNPRLGKRGTIG